MPERPINPDIIREAYKVNLLVDEGAVSTAEASEASRQEIKTMVEQLFDKQYTQNFFRPWEMKEKSMGQKAENLLVELLDQLPFLHVRHASERDDHLQKTDLYLQVDGDEHEVPIQLASFTDPQRLEEKRQRIPNHVLLVSVPMADIFLAYERHDEERLRQVFKRFTGQVLESMKKIPDYLPAYRGLQERLAEARV